MCPNPQKKDDGEKGKATYLYVIQKSKVTLQAYEA